MCGLRLASPQAGRFSETESLGSIFIRAFSNDPGDSVTARTLMLASTEYLYRIGALPLALRFSASLPAAMFGMAYPRDPARRAASHEAAVS